MPTQEQLARNRWIPQSVLRSDLWRFNRRSVPRGVALGLFIGLMIPLAHFIVAAFVAVLVRANVPVAFAATFIGFPAFLPIIYGLAYKIGEWLLRIDAMTSIQPISHTMQSTQSGDLLRRLTGAGLSTAFGLFVIATILAAVGYLGSSFGWRLWIARKRRQRLDHARARRRGEV